MRWLCLALLLTSCANPRIEYRPVPAWLIPARPMLPTVKAAELQCLADDVYERLAMRDRLRAQEADELRALLGGGDGR